MNIEQCWADLANQLDVVLVPGLRDSEEDHWQSHWHRRLPHWLRIKQRDWAQPDLEGWIAAIQREQQNAQLPLLLVGHSFGALASLVWANRHPQRVAGVILVAPAEPLRFELDDIVLPQPLAVPGLLVASHTDPLLTFDRAQYWARNWACELVDIGEAGHINVESGFGEWPWGLERLTEFAQTLVDEAP
ncbi:MULTISPECIES: alpha/beta hydrolase [unclassified Brenneria]|uniref:RBBP9/YdeN family alpha/beta hydrolase n=1 Tax=unclassified Brenneria TaxID=2634434 RepID=UPI0029C26DA1|nr:MULTISPECIES: alpha/beta hydrolase [unclassified Brenneria]MDX5629120.1 alpha/beta hydrolase [Brenneria sp. L3-3Z]MDX5696259.1 alpha/beta hydrolase [Brenneria sp. L4-2C]MEE3662881.1 alpha/beta hydrolase [Brenneria sp. g21c3]